MGRTFYDATGKPIRFDGVTLDHTDRRRREEELNQAKEQAERAARAKDDLVAQLSHELRTPLAPVLMTAAALGEDDRRPADAREQREMIARNVERSARVAGPRGGKSGELNLPNWHMSLTARCP